MRIVSLTPPQGLASVHAMRSKVQLESEQSSAFVTANGIVRKAINVVGVIVGGRRKE